MVFCLVMYQYRVDICLCKCCSFVWLKLMDRNYVQGRNLKSLSGFDKLSNVFSVSGVVLCQSLGLYTSIWAC